MFRVVIPCLFAFIAGPAAAHEIALPLSDGKISTTPRTGYVMSCQSRFGGRGGAFRNGSWIVGRVWYLDQKIHVEGANT